MKILLVTPDYPPPPGGIQTLTKNLEEGLINLGHQVKILHQKPKGHRIPKKMPAVIPKNPRNLLDLPYITRLYRSTREIIQSWNPDVVHSIHVVSWPSLRAAKDAGIPRIASTHALELSDTRQVEPTFRLTNRIHAVSEFTRTLCQKHTDKPIDVINPSISVPSTIPEPEPNGPVFCMSRLVERKNVESLIDAWKKLPDKTRENHGLIIAGDGDRKRKIEIAAEDDDTISVLGRVSESKKEELLRKAAVFALVPTRNGFDVEGFGIVYIEAQSFGNPTIGSSTGGVPEAVGDAGIVVNSPKNIDEISSALSQMLSGDDHKYFYDKIKDRIGQYGLEPIAKQHVKTYQNTID